jgi:hypothetical protein
LFLIKEMNLNEFVEKRTETLFDTYCILEGVPKYLIKDLVQIMTETYLKDSQNTEKNMSESLYKIEKDLEEYLHPIIINGIMSSILSSLQNNFGK